MGHCCEILEFKTELMKSTIQNRCNRWQLYNADLYECGSKGPRFPIKWTGKIFENREEAYKYLETTFGDYDQTAVQFKEGKNYKWAIACEVHC